MKPNTGSSKRSTTFFFYEQSAYLVYVNFGKLLAKLTKKNNGNRTSQIIKIRSKRGASLLILQK